MRPEARAVAVDYLARTIWGEARGEGRSGMEAVASVIMTRVADPRRWPSDVRSVVTQPWQFSAWNRSDVNRPQMLAVTERDAQFRIAREIAERALSGTLADRTGGANHFHTHSVNPSWSRGVRPVAI